MARHSEIYKTTEWEKVRQFVIVRDNGLCVLCRKKGKIKPGTQIDHIEELTDKNKHDWNIAYNPENLQLLCDDCHQHKHGRSIGLQNFVAPL